MARMTTTARASTIPVVLTLLFGSASLATGPDVRPTGLVVEDLFGRVVNVRGLTLVDWEGPLANPAIKFYLVTPPDAALPASAVLKSKEREEPCHGDRTVAKMAGEASRSPDATSQSRGAGF